MAAEPIPIESGCVKCLQQSRPTWRFFGKIGRFGKNPERDFVKVKVILNFRGSRNNFSHQVPSKTRPPTTNNQGLDKPQFILPIEKLCQLRCNLRMGTRPPRWLNCPRKSVIISDKFIAFKTFLDGKFDSQVPMENMFQYPMLKSYVSSNKKELGMVLDLTNTGRFYDRKIVETDGVRYCKLQCRGHGEAPNIDQTKIFLRICDNFFQKNPNKIIGVHCTHGFNRTGFLIVSYLCETEEWRY
eukprot:TCONS_00067084-protein